MSSKAKLMETKWMARAFYALLATFSVAYVGSSWKRWMSYEKENDRTSESNGTEGRGWGRISCSTSNDTFDVQDEETVDRDDSMEVSTITDVTRNTLVSDGDEARTPESRIQSPILDDERVASEGTGNRMRKIEYEIMRSKTLTKGLEMETISTARGMFDIREGWISAWPKRYDLPEHSVRILIAPIGKDPTLTTKATLVVRKVIQTLPLGMQAFINPSKNYHCTLFHLSRPEEVRSNPFLDYRDVPPDSVPRKADDRILEAEIRALMDIGSKTPCLEMEVERVILAPSGVLLLLFLDVTDARGGQVDRLRSRLRESFPGAPKRQPRVVLHCTLLRLLTPVQLPRITREQIDALCQELTQEMRGTRVRFEELHFVHEEVYSTVEGPCRVIPLRDDGCVPSL